MLVLRFGVLTIFLCSFYRLYDILSDETNKAKGIHNVKISEIQKEERPREKLQSYGADALSESELLAIMISTGTREHSAIALGEKIVSKARSVRGLADITMEDLISIKGIGEAKATKIYAALELSKRISKARASSEFKIDSPESIADIYMEELRYLKKEVVKLLLLDTKGKIVGDVYVSTGSLSASIVHPREVFREAIVRSANKIIVIHNHPSGDPDPSEQDVEITKRLQEAGALMGIELLDHIIIGDGEFSSLRRMGYI